MAFLFLASLCLFTVLLCSTSYCVPIESIGAPPVDWKYGHHNPYPGLRLPGPALGNFAEICKVINQGRSQKLICLLCKGFDISCLIPTPPTTTTSSTTSTSSSTTSTSTTTSTTTTTTPRPVTEAAAE